MILLSPQKQIRDLARRRDDNGNKGSGPKRAGPCLR